MNKQCDHCGTERAADQYHDLYLCDECYWTYYHEDDEE